MLKYTVSGMPFCGYTVGGGKEILVSAKFGGESDIHWSARCHDNGISQVWTGDEGLSKEQKIEGLTLISQCQEVSPRVREMADHAMKCLAWKDLGMGEYSAQNYNQYTEYTQLWKEAVARYGKENVYSSASRVGRVLVNPAAL